MYATTFVDFDICRRTASAKILLRVLDLIFEDQQFEISIYLKWSELA